MNQNPKNNKNKINTELVSQNNEKCSDNTDLSPKKRETENKDSSRNELVSGNNDLVIVPCYLESFCHIENDGVFKP